MLGHFIYQKLGKKLNLVDSEINFASTFISTSVVDRPTFSMQTVVKCLAERSTVIPAHNV
jgi:hypothetical protein